MAQSTASGRAAIAMVRVSGDKAIEISDRLFWGDKLAKEAGHTLHYGEIRDGEETVDEVVVGIFRAPASYTKEDVVELSCHGSPLIVQRVVELYLKAGCRLAEPGEFTMRAFANGRFDLSQAEAVSDIIEARSEAAHRQAFRQLRGGVSRKISELRQEMLDFASLLELEIDFGEEDVEFADRKKLEEGLDKTRSHIEELMASFKQGNALKEGLQTVIAGRPNAGKSTLAECVIGRGPGDSIGHSGDDEGYG